MRLRLVPRAGGDVEHHGTDQATDGKAGCGGAVKECCPVTDRNSEGDPVFTCGNHQASAIHLQAAMLTGIQTTTNSATTGIGLVLSAFTVAGEGPIPHHSVEGFLLSARFISSRRTSWS